MTKCILCKVRDEMEGKMCCGTCECKIQESNGVDMDRLNLEYPEVVASAVVENL